MEDNKANKFGLPTISGQIDKVTTPARYYLQSQVVSLSAAVIFGIFYMTSSNEPIFLYLMLGFLALVLSGWVIGHYQVYKNTPQVLYDQNYHMQVKKSENETPISVELYKPESDLILRNMEK